MKKTIKYLSLLVITLLVVTGCGSKKDPKNVLEDALNNMRDVKSASIAAKFTVGMKSEEMTLNMDFDVDGKYDENKNFYMKIKTSLFGFTENQEMYIIEKDGLTYTYTGNDDGWTYTTEEASQLVPLPDEEWDESIDELLGMIKEVKEEKTDRDGYTKLTVTLDKDKLIEAMKEEDEEIQDDIKLEGDLTFNLYVKDGYIAIIEMDISDIVNQATDDEVEMNMTLKLTLELSDYNKIDAIVLPKEVEENAVLEIEIDEDFEV